MDESKSQDKGPTKDENLSSLSSPCANDPKPGDDSSDQSPDPILPPPPDPATLSDLVRNGMSLPTNLQDLNRNESPSPDDINPHGHIRNAPLPWTTFQTGTGAISGHKRGVSQSLDIEAEAALPNKRRDFGQTENDVRSSVPTNSLLNCEDDTSRATPSGSISLGTADDAPSQDVEHGVEDVAISKQSAQNTQHGPQPVPENSNVPQPQLRSHYSLYAPQGDTKLDAAQQQGPSRTSLAAEEANDQTSAFGQQLRDQAQAAQPQSVPGYASLTSHQQQQKGRSLLDAPAENNSSILDVQTPGVSELVRGRESTPAGSDSGVVTRQLLTPFNENMNLRHSAANLGIQKNRIMGPPIQPSNATAGRATHLPPPISMATSRGPAQGQYNEPTQQPQQPQQLQEDLQFQAVLQNPPLAPPQNLSPGTMFPVRKEVLLWVYERYPQMLAEIHTQGEKIKKLQNSNEALIREVTRLRSELFASTQNGQGRLGHLQTAGNVASNQHPPGHPALPQNYGPVGWGNNQGYMHAPGPAALQGFAMVGQYPVPGQVQAYNQVPVPRPNSVLDQRSLQAQGPMPSFGAGQGGPAFSQGPMPRPNSILHQRSLQGHRQMPSSGTAQDPRSVTQTSVGGTAPSSDPPGSRDETEAARALQQLSTQEEKSDTKIEPADES